MKKEEVKARFHLKFRTADVLKALERADEAEAAYKKAGGWVYWGWHQKPVLAVNVKSCVFDRPPEIKTEDAETEYMLRDWELSGFWEFDLNPDFDEGLHESLGTDTYHFPKINSAGRSGGNLIFDNSGSKYLHDRAIAMMHQDKTAEQVLAEELDCYSEEYWEEESGFEIQDAIDEITHEAGELALFLEDATKWVKHVVACQKYREKNLEGKHIEYLEGHVANNRYELFDLANCTAVFNSEEDEVTVSWPQHARVFEDSGDWVDCDEYTPGAKKWGGTITAEGTVKSEEPVFKTWVPGGVETFSFTLTFQEFIDALEPKIAQARRLLNS